MFIFLDEHNKKIMKHKLTHAEDIWKNIFVASCNSNGRMSMQSIESTLEFYNFLFIYYDNFVLL